MGAEQIPDTSGTRHRVLVELSETGVEIAVSGEPAAVAALLKRLRPARRPACAGSPLAGLTPLETTVATLVGQALTNQQIANRLNISPHTVNYHLRQIFRKLAIGSRVHLAMLVRLDHEGREGGRRH
jgi:DNA-binding CsgD family transcriptional regulator